MSKIIVNKVAAEGHINRISGIANEFNLCSNTSHATRTTLSAIGNGNDSFDDSQRVLMMLAELSNRSASNIAAIVQNVISIDQQQAVNFESSGGAASR